MVYLKFILEAYEGMSVMSTVDNTNGVIRIAVMPGFEADMDALLALLGSELQMEPLKVRHGQVSRLQGNHPGHLMQPVDGCQTGQERT
jgi:hypothetical protein